MTSRSDAIDNARAIGIVLVVFGHAMGVPGWAGTLIFAMHMPLFFVLSGWVLKDSAWQQPLDGYLRRQWRALMLPFGVFFAVSYAYWLLTSGIGSRAEKFADVAWYEPLAGLVTGRFAELEPINGPLWFFGALLVAGVGHAAACRALGPRAGGLLTMALAVATLVGGTRLGQGLPFSADIAVIGAGFLAAGHAIGRRVAIDAVSRRLAGLWAALLAPAFVLMASNGGPVDLAQWRFGHDPWQMIATALIGTALVLCVARVLPATRVGRWLSAHTLVIFPTHVLALNLVSGLAQMGLGWSQDDVRTPAFAVASTVLALLAAVPAAWWLQRTLPSVFKPATAASIGRSALAGGSTAKPPRSSAFGGA